MIDAAECCVVSQLPSLDDVGEIAERVDRGEYDCTKGYAEFIYCPEAEMCITENGFHHAAAISFFKKGIIAPKKVCSLKDMFSHVHISDDGGSWIDTRTTTNLGAVRDYRVALIYELLQHKDKLIGADGLASDDTGGVAITTREKMRLAVGEVFESDRTGVHHKFTLEALSEGRELLSHRVRTASGEELALEDAIGLSEPFSWIE
ncbi:MAG: hypothetical protein LBT22_00445 [Peptococcaceae bacterium]|jgi:hypothetical protein|nr:hypothetical protein [Peptococcaceae bacterium]